MYFTLELIREIVVEGQPQKHFTVHHFEDAEKTISTGQSTFVAGGISYDDPEAYLANTLANSLTAPLEPSYADKRHAAYPPISDYLDGVVKGDQAQIDAYIAACKAVKTKYPKP
jgi:hypothetical protein